MLIWIWIYTIELHSDQGLFEQERTKRKEEEEKLKKDWMTFDERAVSDIDDF